MRPEKQSITDEIRNQVQEAVFVILADYRGLGVEQTNTLRNRLDGVNARVQVIKNALFRHAAEDLCEKGLDAGLDGPTAMVHGQGDVVQVSKVLKDFIKEHQLPVIKVGAFEGAVLSADDIREIASLPSREVLLAQVVGTIAAPMSQMVGVLNQKLSTLLYVLKAIQEKKEAA